MKIILLLLSVITYNFAQTYQFQKSIGSFEGASAFDISSLGIIYVADKEVNEIAALDTLGNILDEIGGYGWDNGNFDNPTDISSILNVYVCDYNNNRIQLFDKDLNFVTTLTDINSDEKLAYPIASVISNQNDLFILEKESKRIIRIDPFGNTYIFGNYSSIEFNFKNPKDIEIDNNNNIYVLDDNLVYKYDYFSNTLNKIKLNENFTGMNYSNNALFLTNDSTLAHLNINTNALNTIVVDSKDIIGAQIYKNTLYILTKTNIHIYKKE